MQRPPRIRLPSQATTAVYAIVLFLLNIYVAQDLLRSEFTKQVASSESSLISVVAYTTQAWGDLDWFPLWHGGTPFHNVLQPGLIVTTAGIASLFHLTPQHAYHLVMALIFAFGPLTLFWLCYRITLQSAYSFGVGVFYSLLSPAALLLDHIGLFHSYRFDMLVRQGVGQQIAFITLLPLVILCIYLAAVKKNVVYLSIGSVTLALLLLTDWPGIVGITIPILAFCLSEVGTPRLSWPRIILICVLGYLLAGRWLPPSTLELYSTNADGRPLSIFVWAGILTALIAFSLVLGRLIKNSICRFGIHLSVMAGLVSLAGLHFHLDLLPKPAIYMLEMEIGLAICLCYAASVAAGRLPRSVQQIAVTLLVVGCIPLTISNRRFARNLDSPFDMKATSEYRVAEAFARLRPRDRVFASGNISRWMNVWTSTPQVFGCCADDIPNEEHPASEWAIHSGQNSGDRDAEVSVLWLRAWGATAVAVSGPKSTDPLRQFTNPTKFDGVLPVLWRNNDDVIYDIPSPTRSLAHVIPLKAVIARAPEHGQDIEPIEAYVTAIPNPLLPPAPLTWRSRQVAQIITSMRPGQILAVQITYDKGWHARVGTSDRPIKQDPLGQMLVDTGCNGACNVDLIYDGGSEARLMAVLQVLGLILTVAAPILLTRFPEFRTAQLGRFVYDRRKLILVYSSIVVCSIIISIVAFEVFLSYRESQRVALPFYNDLYPYVMFRPRANASYATQQTHPMSHNKTPMVTYTNEDAFRVSAAHYRLPKDKPAGQLRIAFLGGSLVQQGSTFGATLPGSLKTVLQQKYPGRDVEVINAGIQSAVSRQSLVQLLVTVVDYHPDVVILYDGGNDLGLPLTYESRPNYPYNFQTMEQAWDLYRENHRSSIFQLMLDRSYLYRFIRARLNPQGTQVVPTSDDPFAGTNAVPPERVIYDPSFAPEHVSEYLSNWRKLIELSAAYGYIPVCILTPAGGLDRVYAIPKMEEAFHLDKAHAEKWIDAFDVLYGEAGREIARMQPRYPDAILMDLTHYLKPSDKYFWDLAHVYDEANMILAQRIYAGIQPKVEAFWKKQK